ncbi:MAG: hypothetical protein PHE73_06850 [Sulfurovaceae bacterium]|nr:hypothetical protein [Sulfurovaceae bacterium]
MQGEITFFIGSLSSSVKGVCVNVANGLTDRGWDVNLVCMNLKRKERLASVSEKINLVDLNISHFAFGFIPLLKYLKQNKVKNIVSLNRI